MGFIKSGRNELHQICDIWASQNLWASSNLEDMSFMKSGIYELQQYELHQIWNIWASNLAKKHGIHLFCQKSFYQKRESPSFPPLVYPYFFRFQLCRHYGIGAYFVADVTFKWDIWASCFKIEAPMWHLGVAITNLKMLLANGHLMRLCTGTDTRFYGKNRVKRPYFDRLRSASR